MEFDASKVLSLIRVGGIFTGFVVLLMTWLAGRLLTLVSHRLARIFSGQRLMVEQFTALVRFVVYVSGGFLAVSSAFALSSEVLTLLGGTLAVTLGLALKDEASSILAAVVILVERPFQVGDRVAFGGYYGEIRSIGLRSVRLQTLDDNEVTIPNSKFLTDPVASGNSGELTMLVQQDFYIRPDQDVATAKRVVSESLVTSPYFNLSRPWAVLVSQESVGHGLAIRLRAKAYVVELRFEKTFASDVCERTLDGFRQHGVLTPDWTPPAPPAPAPQAPAA